MAGIIAARHNSIGSRGIAPEATIFNYALNDFSGTIWANQNDYYEALTLHHRRVAVSNNSWGHGWTGLPQPYHRRIWQAIEKGISDGFYGRGTSYISAGYNRSNSLASFDEKLNHYGVVAVCGVSHQGTTKGIYARSYGSGLWVCAPQLSITTGHNNTWGNSGGTSSATAVVSGVTALVRGANPQLSWRDVKLILAGTARKNDPSEPNWTEGALKYGSTSHRYAYNENYGFGVVDAGAAVELAKSWKTLPPMRTVSHSSGNIELVIPDLSDGDEPTTVISTIEVPNVIGATPGFTEHVEITVDFDHPSFRDLDLELVSPAGTVSVLSYPDPHNIYLGKALTERFRFASTKNLGENPVGVWQLRIADHRTGHEGKLKTWSIKVRGHGQGVDVPADHIPGLDPTSPQSAPTDLTVAIIDQTVTLAWQPPAHYGDYVSGYKILRRNAGGGEVAMSTLMEDTASRAATYVDYTTYVTGVEYVYQVVALWDDTESLPSNTADVTPPDGYSPLNAPPTGQPAITGGAHPGETLAVDVSGIDDQNGLTGVSYSYQWLADDTAILGETASTYEVPDGDIGKAIKVRVSFTDDRENQETLTSAATAQVAVKPNSPATGAPTIAGTAQGGESLNVDTSGIADEDGLIGVSYGYQWIRSDGDSDTDIQGETSPTYALGLGDIGKTIKVRVSFADNRENQETLTSEATEAVAAKPNTEPTGFPNISGMAQVGQTLAADTSAIADADGLINTTFRHQWIHSDGNADTDIDGATGPTYRVLGSDFNKTIQVRVSFTDDWRNEESLTSVATAPVAYVEGPPGAPQDVKGKAGDTEFTVSWQPPVEESKAPVEQYQLRYWAEGESIQEVYTTKLSQAIESLTNGVTYKVQVTAQNPAGYGTPSDELSVTPRPADSVRPETPHNLSGRSVYHRRVALDWDDVPGADSYQVQFYDWNSRTLDILPFAGITISFDGSSAVVDDLPEGRFWWLMVRAVNAHGSSEWTEYIQFFPTKASDWEPEDINSSATGQPTISGVTRVGEILTAHASGVADEDGTTTVTFSYQWIRNDGNDDADIDGAVSSTYELSHTDVGRVIKVRVTFTDDAENEESLTSAATAAVEARPNAEPTGLPTITGTAQAEETLTSDTSKIADADGLTNPSFSYQWIRNDGNAEADIDGETNSTYTVDTEDVGKTIKVRVTFTDDAEHGESLTSEPTESVVPAAVDASVWSATLTAGISGNSAGYSLFQQLGELSSTRFSVAKTAYVVRLILHDGDTLYLRLNLEAPSGLMLQIGAAEFALADASVRRLQGAPLYQWPKGLVEWSNGEKLLVSLDMVQDADPSQSTGNTAPTGFPTISGKAQVGETLTADTSGIADADGLTNPNFSYQWIRNDGSADTDIGGETAPTYTPSKDDVGKTIKVEVTFTDDAENEESLTSGPTAEVAATVPGPPQHLNVSRHGSGALDLYWEAPASDGGSPVAGYKVQWKEIDAGWGAAEDVSQETVTGTTHTLAGLTDGVTYSIRVLATNGIGDGTPSGEETGTPHETTPPELAGATLDGGTLTLTYSEGLDEASEPETGAFNVAVNDTPRGVDEVSVSGNAVVLTLASAVAAGDMVSVTYTAPTGSSATPIRDLPGNAAASFGNQSVTNNTRAPVNSNSAPTGLPVITGTAQVDEMLTVDVSGIDDADGLDNATFSYQWMRTEGGTDTDIAGEKDQTYSPSDGDVGRTIRVRVTFSDEAENEQSLTSEPTAVVVAATTVPGQPMHLRVFPHDAQGLDVSWEAPASDGGSPVTGYKVQWKEADGVWDAPADVSQETVSGSTHTIDGLTDGVEYVVRVIARNDVGDGAPTAEAMGTPRETTPPQIVMARVDGATLRVSYDEALDEDSVPPADAFLVKVACRCDDTRWQDEEARRGVDGVSVDGDAVVLTLASVATAEDDVVISYTPPQDEASPRILDAAGNAAAAFQSTLVFNDTEESVEEETAENAEPTGLPTISGTLRVGETLTASTSGIADADGLDNPSFSFQWMRDDGNAHTDIAGETGQTYDLSDGDVGRSIRVRVSFTDDAENAETLTSAATGAVAPRPPLTASFQSKPSSHDGQAAFTFELRFSEELPVSYLTLRDHAFTVVGGTVIKAQRLTQGSNVGWRITVQPDGNGDVTVALPATTDCDANGAVCTGDGRKLSNSLSFTVSGPPQ